ncbi:hypothetical protein LJC69_04070 [Bacteroidales bacterium OttesenSCG-928-K22]|nr:hypothetical protein [Bacteroidales bacterium OttesenSCG-928-K22]
MDKVDKTENLIPPLKGAGGCSDKVDKTDKMDKHYIMPKALNNSNTMQAQHSLGIHHYHNTSESRQRTKAREYNNKNKI